MGEQQQGQAVDPGVEVLRLDAIGDHFGLFRYLMIDRPPPDALLMPLATLGINGRIQSAFVVARHLGGLGIENPLVHLMRAIGGILYENVFEADRGSEQLAELTARLKPAQLARFRETLATPALKQARAQVGDKPGLAEKFARLERGETQAAPVLEIETPGGHIWRLDGEGNYAGILTYLNGAEFQTPEIVQTLCGLVAKGRFQSAFLVAKFLSARGIINPAIDFARALGGIIFNNETDEGQGARDLHDHLPPLNAKQRAELNDLLVARAVPQAIAVEASGNAVLIDKLLRLRDLALGYDRRATPGGARVRSVIDAQFWQTEFYGVLRGRFARLGENNCLYDLDNRVFVTPMQHDDTAFGQYEKSFGAYDRDAVHRYASASATREVRGMVLLTPAYPKNIFHVMVEAYGALRMLEPQHRLVGHGPELAQYAWQREMIAKCLDGREVRVLDGTELLIDPVILFGFPNPAGFDFVRSRVGRLAKPGNEVVLIERSGPTTRINAAGKPLSNAGRFAETPAWKKLLKRYNVRRTNFGGGELTVSEQIARLDGAHIVIASHGAAMANFLFLDPPAKVIEIVEPQMFSRDGFVMISNHNGLPHRKLLCDRSDREGRMLVDVGALEALIEEFGAPRPSVAKPPAKKPAAKKPAKPRRKAKAALAGGKPAAAKRPAR